MLRAHGLPYGELERRGVASPCGASTSGTSPPPSTRTSCSCTSGSSAPLRLDDLRLRDRTGERGRRRGHRRAGDRRARLHRPRLSSSPGLPRRAPGVPARSRRLIRRRSRRRLSASARPRDPSARRRARPTLARRPRSAPRPSTTRRCPRARPATPTGPALGGPLGGVGQSTVRPELDARDRRVAAGLDGDRERTVALQLLPHPGVSRPRSHHDLAVAPKVRRARRPSKMGSRSMAAAPSPSPRRRRRPRGREVIGAAR